MTNNNYGVADFQNVFHMSKRHLKTSIPEMTEGAPMETNDVISLFH